MKDKNKKYSIIAIVIALIFILIGINKKEFEAYYSKAKMICTQCIGIG